ncbi:universal stress protein [Curvibacter fontanus]|jgi:nucleotide-binding universal stress UspA family protein
MYKQILLAYDGSAPGQQALLDSHEIAQWSQAELTLIAVMPLPITTMGPEGGVYDDTLEESERNRYQAILDTGVRKLKEAGLSARGEVVTGDPVRELARAATRIGADLMVLGHKHLDGWAARWWRGSVSKALIEHAPCSVLVVITH